MVAMEFRRHKTFLNRIDSSYALYWLILYIIKYFLVYWLNISPNLWLDYLSFPYFIISNTLMHTDFFFAKLNAYRLERK